MRSRVHGAPIPRLRRSPKTRTPEACRPSPSMPGSGPRTTPGWGPRTTPGLAPRTTPGWGPRTTPESGLKTTPGRGRRTTPESGPRTGGSVPATLESGSKTPVNAGIPGCRRNAPGRCFAYAEARCTTPTNACVSSPAMLRQRRPVRRGLPGRSHGGVLNPCEVPPLVHPGPAGEPQAARRRRGLRLHLAMPEGMPQHPDPFGGSGLLP